MKRLLKQVLGFLLVKWFFLTRKTTDNILSVTFHCPTPAMMTDLIGWLKMLRYEIISLPELEEVLAGRSSRKRVAFITLDDGWRSNLRLLPVLEQYRVPVAIFIPVQAVMEGNFWWEYAASPGQESITGLKDVEAFKKLGNTERVAKVQQLKENIKLDRSCFTVAELERMASSGWITLGSHTVTHPILDKCSREEQEFEVVESRRLLQEMTGKSIDYFAYPNGDYDKETIRLAQQAGYRLCFTDSPGKITAPFNNLCEIPRNSLNDEGGYFENYAKLLGIWQRVID